MKGYQQDKGVSKMLGIQGKVLSIDLRYDCRPNWWEYESKQISQLYQRNWEIGHICLIYEGCSNTFRS